jgi:transcriptional regulator with XRE-family HTH domain
VRKFRGELGLSQEQLAFDAGLHRTYISGVERGVRNPTITVLEQIAGARSRGGPAPGRARITFVNYRPSAGDQGDPPVDLLPDGAR